MKKRKKRGAGNKVKLGGGQLLPPLKPALPAKAELGSTLSVAREKVIGGGADAPTEETALSRLSKTRNRWIRDADFDTPSSKRYAAALREMSKSMPSDSLFSARTKASANKGSMTGKTEKFNRHQKSMSTSQEGLPSGVVAALSASDSAELFGHSIDEQLKNFTATGAVSPLVPNQDRRLKFAHFEGSTNLSDLEEPVSSTFSYDSNTASDTDLKSSFGRSMNVNMSIRIPATEDASQRREEDRAAELGLDSAR